MKKTMWFFVTIFCVLFIFLTVAYIRDVQLSKSLREQERILKEERQKNEKTQADLLAQIDQKEKEKQEAIEEAEEAYKNIKVSSQRLTEQKRANTALHRERDEAIAAGKGAQEQLEIADRQILSLNITVKTAEEKADDALSAAASEKTARIKAEGIAVDWEKKYNSEVTLRKLEHDAFTAAKAENRSLRLKGTLGTVAGFAIGGLAGILIFK